MGKNSSRGSNQISGARRLSKNRVWERVSKAAGREEVKVSENIGCKQAHGAEETAKPSGSGSLGTE